MSVEEHGFKTEVQQLLDLMIHSLYSDREIFVRELVSNAADALDKVRFLGLTESDLVPAAGEEHGIRITVDADARTVTIEDDGIGMTKEEVLDNLGTIAKSGSKEFLAKMKAAGEGDAEAPSLIGQFGVGFYSAFMVAERVEVETRSAHAGSEGVLWKSEGGGSYTTEPCNRTVRGTRITLFLREDAEDFSDAGELRRIVVKHSNFLPWPIQVEGEQANTGKALWKENPSSVTDEEANAFYKTLSGDWSEPGLRVHTSVDSPIQYNAMLFVPGTQPFDLYRVDRDWGPRLYAKRVLIVEHAKQLLPEWLRFVQGVIDSEDISLNVSREMVQKTPVVQKIRDNVIKRLLKDLTRLAGREGEPEVIDEEEEEGWKPQTYFQIWKNFGGVLKEGYYNDATWREKLLPLLRFNALSHDDAEGQVSLAAYKEAMPEGQDTIWYLTGENREQALQSPHLEAFRKRGWDVLVLTDPIDEWLVGVLTDFDGVPVKSVARGELELEDEGDDADKADLEGLSPYLTELFGGRVAGVRGSSRLTDSAAVLVDAEDGVGANLERILKQAKQFVPNAQRTLELNRKHPLVKNLAALHESGRTEELAPLAELLLDDAMLMEGTVAEPAAVGKRLEKLLERASALALGSGAAE